MAKQKIIIDCDPGIDDSLALLYALQHSEVEVVAITVVEGNVPVDLGYQNVYKILERLGQTKIPVYMGADKPLVRDFVSAQDTHGMDGLGETQVALEGIYPPPLESAAEFLAAYFATSQETSLIALGPLTNIALALEKNPLLGQHCQRFVTMGGTYKSNGNCSPVAEYNYWCDPHAAQQVYQKLGKTIEMVGLDVTREIVLTPNILEYMRQVNPQIAQFVADITRFYYDFHWEYEHILGCVINDPLAVAHFLMEGLCQGFEAYTDVVTEGIALGQTVVDAFDFYKKPSNAYILTEVDRPRFFEDFLSVILHASVDSIKKDMLQLSL